MKCESISRATNRTGISNQTESGHRTRYFGLASMIDLMFDQLKYCSPTKTEAALPDRRTANGAKESGAGSSYLPHI